MFKKLMKMITPEPLPASITSALRKELDSLRPGQAMRLRCHSDGAEFVIINADDFDHICSLANLKNVPAESSQT